MLLPYLKAKENVRVQLKVFSGLDARDKIADSSLADMMNMSSDAIPSLVPRDARKHIAEVPGATEICAPEYTGGELDSFTGVRDGKFYYKGTMIEGTLTEGKKSIADFNGKICIFPDKVYYDYLPSLETGLVGSKLVSMEKSTSFGSARFYSSYNSITGVYSSYISSSEANFDQAFAVGDSVVISNCNTKKNNTKVVYSRKDFAAEDDIVSVVVIGVSKTRLDVLLYNKKGEKVTFTNVSESNKITVRLAIPDMDNICVHNNRLWGTATSGECIYASKLGDCTNFNSFQGLSDDSWYGFVGTGGGFTGICSYRTAVVAFKRGFIHHIYGDAPINFSMPKSTNSGCVDGKSICEIGGILYYLSEDGFRAYSGGEPYGISENIRTRYESCVAGTDGRKYYASAVDASGKTDVLVYDTEADVWTREDNTPFIGFCNYNGKLYAITQDDMWQLEGGTDTVLWSIESKRFTYDMIEQKGITSICARMDMGENSVVRVYVATDNNDFVGCGTITPNGFYVYRVPVRFDKCESFRVKFEGEGRVVIHDIELTSYNGGRTF